MQPSTKSRSPKHTLSPLPTPQRGASASNSMPSSPTSIRSSTSAIFERDIEQPLHTLSSSNSHFKDPHKVARAANHEPTDMSVPSVLTSAVFALGSTSDRAPSRGASTDEISIVAPSPLNPQNWTSPDSLRPTYISRSPSPTQRATLPPRSATLLPPGAFPSESTVLPSVSISAEPLPMLDLPSPSIMGVVVPPTPSSNHHAFSSPSPPTTSTPLTPPAGNSRPGSPKVVIANPPTHLPPPRSLSGSTRTASRPPSFVGLSLEELSLAPLMSTSPDSDIPVPQQGLNLKLPPSPTLGSTNKRLSFISYNDLLLSTPITSFPLSSVTNPQSTSAPGAEPPHQVVASSRASLVGVPPMTKSDGIQQPLPVRPAHTHDAGGEWEREGLGRGLEERLEAYLDSAKGN